MTDYVMTLLADAAREPLDEALVRAAAQRLNATQVEWLKSGEACDIFWNHNDTVLSGSGVEAERKAPSVVEQALYYIFDTIALAASVAVGESDAVFLYPETKNSGASPVVAAQAAEASFNGHPFDVIVQPVDARQRKLLIADMDSTMIQVECIDELADFVGKKAEVSAITERAMNGELNFEQALTERVRLLRGLPEAVLQQCYNERVKMTPGASALLDAARAKDMHCVLVSGGFTFFTSRVAVELGFHEQFANELVIYDGLLTGEVAQPILGKEAKLRTLQMQCTKLGISPAEVMAIGDGANDLPMLLEAGLGVAYHAKPVVRRHAKAQLNHCDLGALAWVLG